MERINSRNNCENFKTTTSIQIQSVGNGWLFRSAIAKTSKLVSSKDLEYIFTKEEVHNVQVKAIGGRFVIVTFPDALIRDSTINKKWLSNWFEEIKPWNGEQAKDERFVRLSYFGMPLNVWSTSTFKEIGSHWGHFIQVDENTLKEISYDIGSILIATEQTQKIAGNVELEVEGRKYSVRVVEEDSFRTIAQNKFPFTFELEMEKEHEKENEEDDDMDEVAKNANLEASMNLYVVNNGVEVESLVEETQIVDEGLQCNNVKAAVMDSVSSSSHFDICPVGNGKCPIISSVDPGVNQENYHNNILGHDDCNSAVPTECEPELFLDNDIGVEAGPPLEHLDVNEMIPVKAAIKGVKGKKKRKSINDILGFSKVDLHDRKGGRNKQKCVVFRSAVAAAALSASISSEGIVNRNKMFLSEAQAIWTVNKTMGIGYDGDEEEVISKIADSLAQDKERTPT